MIQECVEPLDHWDEFVFYHNKYHPSGSSGFMSETSKSLETKQESLHKISLHLFSGLDAFNKII